MEGCPSGLRSTLGKRVERNLTQVRILSPPHQIGIQISKTLGQNIKRIRLRRKMSQGDICRAIDMDRSYMSAIESGKKNVTIAVVEKLARTLDVSVNELLK